MSARRWTGRFRLLALALLVEGGMLFLACGLGYLFGCPIPDQLRLDANQVALGIAAAVPLAAGFFIMWCWPAGPLAQIKQFLEEMVRQVFGRCSFLELAVISALAGLGEECLFRGVIQTCAIRSLGVPAGLMLASLLFGLGHCITLTYAVLAAAIGLYFGLLALATGSLLAPAIAHGLYDFFALLLITHWLPAGPAGQNGHGLGKYGSPCEPGQTELPAADESGREVPASDGAYRPTSRLEP